MKTNVDLVSNGQGTGPVAQHLTANGEINLGAMRPYLEVNAQGQYRPMATVYVGGNPKEKTSYKTSLVANAVLRRDEWKSLDAAVLMVARTRLNGIQDLIDKGLTYTLGNGMGTTVLEWHDVSDALEAEMTMDGVSRSKNGAVDYNFNYLPIPIIHVDYEINQRVLMTSRTMGNPLDTTMAEQASRRVAEKLESLLFTDTSYSYGQKDSRNRNTIFSYINHPDRNPITITAWDALPSGSNVGKLIIKDILNAKAVLITKGMYGPYQIYIPAGYEVLLDEDYSDAKGTNTIRERILQIDKVDGIKVVDTLPANNVVMVQMTQDVVRLVEGMGLQNVQWSTEGNMVNKFKVMTIRVPQIRSDQNGNCGVAHLSA